MRAPANAAGQAGLAAGWLDLTSAQARMFGDVLVCPRVTLWSTQHTVFSILFWDCFVLFERDRYVLLCVFVMYYLYAHPTRVKLRRLAYFAFTNRAPSGVNRNTPERVAVDGVDIHSNAHVHDVRSTPHVFGVLTRLCCPLVRVRVRGV